MFTSGGEMAWKLMDLQNFAVYFDHELLGSLEGQGLIVSGVRVLFALCGRIGYLYGTVSGVGVFYVGKKRFQPHCEWNSGALGLYI